MSRRLDGEIQPVALRASHTQNQLENDVRESSGKGGKSDEMAVILTWTCLGCQPPGTFRAGGQTLIKADLGLV